MSASKDLTAKLKDYKSASSPDACEAILKKWAASFEESSAIADSLEALSVSIQQGTEPSRDKAPAPVIDALMRYRMDLQNIAKDLYILRGAVLLRIPEIKEEDNLGVNVQLQVLSQIKSFASSVTGSNGSSSGKDESPSASSLPSVGLVKEYLAARASIEEKLLGTSEKEGPSKSQSLVQQLVIFDSDAVARLSRGYRELILQQQFLISSMTLNYKKLYAPRVERVMH